MVYDKVSKKAANEFLGLVKSANTILLHCHPFPDIDSYSSALGLAEYLESQGKDVHLIKGDSEIRNRYSYLPNFDKIENMSFSEVDLGRFDLFICLDSQDNSRISRTDNFSLPSSLKIINIDHHPENSINGDLNIVSIEASSTSEMLFNLLNHLNFPISPSMAANFFLGLYDDTNCFKNSNTVPKSFLTASQLSQLCPNFIDYIRQYENSNTPEDIKMITLALKSVKTYFNNQVAISSISYLALEKSGLLSFSGKKAWTSQFLRTVNTWKITIAMSENEPGVSGLSLRSQDPKWDVSKIAAAVGEGGGHPVASGATIYKKAPAALKLLLKAIASTYPELGQP